MDGSETLTILAELRGEILKDCRSLFADEFATLMADYEEQTREAQQRELMDFLLENMPGADRVEELPELLREAQETQHRFELLRQEQDQKVGGLEVHTNEKFTEWAAFSQAMKDEMENMSAKQNRHLTDDIRKMAELKATLSGVKFNNDMLMQQVQQLSAVVGQMLANDEIRLALDSQDEKDRAEVALYGLKGSDKVASPQA